MTPTEMGEAMRKLSKERREAQRWFEDEQHTEAEAEFEYRKERGTCWARFQDLGTAKQREDAVDAFTADKRKARDLARGRKQAALEKIRGVRQEMSMFQTFMAVQRSEAELHRFDEGDG